MVTSVVISDKIDSALGSRHYQQAAYASLAQQLNRLYTADKQFYGMFTAEVTSTLILLLHQIDTLETASVRGMNYIMTMDTITQQSFRSYCCGYVDGVRSLDPRVIKDD